MKKVRRNELFVVIGILLVMIGTVMVWFCIPYSPTKATYQKDVNKLINNNKLETNHELFTEEDFSNLPMTIQRYIQDCGYIGKPKMSYMKIEFKAVDFVQGRKGPKLKIDYTQYNFIAQPSRMAFIDSSMFGIPFEGYDYYQNGHGGMKGVIAKGITLFDQKGADMDKACLVTFLAESMFAPSILMQDYISFEEINDFEMKAAITYQNQTASGIFTFNEKYEIISFVTNDRAITNSDGTMEYMQWSAVCSEYAVSENGIKQPAKLQAVWNYPDGDFIYFDGIINRMSYGFE